ncbi:MAG: hypothetical protein ACRD8W_15175 [Nitrososphaeraceae archaeon]
MISSTSVPFVQGQEQEQEQQQQEPRIYEVTEGLKSKHTKIAYRPADLLHITESDAELEAANASEWGRGQEYSLNTTAEIYHNMRIVEGLIKRLQEEGLLRKKPKISI